MVVPYLTWSVAGWSVVQVMVAEEGVIPVAVANEIAGAEAPPVPVVGKVKLADTPAGTAALLDSATKL